MKSVFLTLMAAFLLSACQTTSSPHAYRGSSDGYYGTGQSQGNFKVGSPYKVLGKWYTPREDYNLIETGIASWYGPDFHGKLTANGEVYDMNELTAAHKTLQIPSLVRVTNLENGRSVVVRVNDRGPFKRGRIIDLSKKAAELLDIISNGTARVRLEVMTEESKKIAQAAKRGESTRGTELAMNNINSPNVLNASAKEAITTLEKPLSSVDMGTADNAQVASVEVEELKTSKIPGHSKEGKFYPDPVVEKVAVAPTNIFVQAGSFTQESNATAYAQKLSGIAQAKVYPAMVNGKQYYRVRIPTMDVAQADQVLQKMVNVGNSQALIIVE